METTEDKCIILKQKEYNDLLKKSKENRGKEIRIYWYHRSRVDVSGDFVLGNKLFSQIQRIIHSISEEHEKERDNAVAYAQKSAKQYTIGQFKKLPWHQRLFFKDKYII